MKPDLRSPGVSRRTVFSTLPALALAAGSPLSASAAGPTAPDPLPSWNDGAAKRAIFDFIRRTTDKASRDFVPPVDRIATFDQDGTLWVEHPLYTPAMFALDRVRILAAHTHNGAMRSPSKPYSPTTSRRWGVFPKGTGPRSSS